MKNWIILTMVAVIPALHLQAQSEKMQSDQGQQQSPGQQAIEKAKKDNKYLFIFLFKQHDPQSKKMESVFDSAMQNIGDKGRGIKVDVQNKDERALLEKFRLKSAPTPFVLILAPNGAIMGGFPNKFTEQDLSDSFASPGVEKTYKALQEGKLVFISIQNKNTSNNSKASAGVQDFKADPRYSDATVIITIDPADQKEADFLEQLKVDPNTKEAVTVFLAPPGQMIGTFNGPTTKQQLATALEKETSKGSSDDQDGE